MKKKFLLGLLFFSLLGTASGPRPAAACTLWAAAGDRTVDGAILIGKNRDWWAGRSQALRLLCPAGGFRYLGLYAVGRRFQGEKAGVNEKGLVMVSAAASVVPWRLRRRAPATGNLMDRILASCDSVDAVVRKRHLFTSPCFYLIADRSKIAIIEVGLHGRRSIKVKYRDVLYHTNHYLDGDLAEANQKYNLSSLLRFYRIRYLIKAHREPLAVEDFMAFSRDRHDGPDDSIWRSGSPGEVQTLSTWIVSVPKDDAPTLYVRLTEPGEPEKNLRLRLDASFWARGAPGVIREPGTPSWLSLGSGRPGGPEDEESLSGH